MRQVHWSEVTPQPFLRSPSLEMLTEAGLLVPQTSGARNTKTPPELREIVMVKFDASYIAAFFNNKFSSVGIPTLSQEQYLECIQNAQNPLAVLTSSNEQTNEYETFYHEFCDLISTFAAMLPESGNNSRDPNAYTARWYHAVKLLERLETLAKIEFTPRKIDESVLKGKVKRL